MATNPDQGFGDSVVLPYRPRGFDYTPYQFMGAQQDRVAQERAAKAKRDLETLSKFGKISDETKGNPALQAKQAAYKQYIGAKIDKGEDISQQELAQLQGDLDLESAENIAEKQQYDQHVKSVIPDYEKTYGNAYNKGLANLEATKGYWETPRGGFKAQADPTQATHLYDLPVAAQDFAKNFANIHASSQSSESSQEDPEKATSYSNSIGSVFMVADPSNPKRLIPGVGQKHIDEFLNEKNGVAAKKIDKEIVLPEYQADAKRIAELAKTDKNYSKYAMMTTDQITQDLLTNGNPLRKGANGTPLNQAGYRNQVARQQLEAYNNEVRKTVFSNEEKAPGYDSTYGSNVTNKFLATPGTFAQTSPQSTTTTDAAGKKTITYGATKRFDIPGIATTRDGATLKPISINPKLYRDLSSGQIIQSPSDRVEYTPQHLGTAMMGPDGRLVAIAPDELVTRINNSTEALRAWNAGGRKGPKPPSFEGWTPTLVSSGYIDTKLDTEGKSPENLKPGETIVDIYNPDEGKTVKMIRKTVTIPVRQGDDVETYLNAQSGNSLRNRTLTPQEQAIHDAWKKYNQELFTSN